ncbi:orotidine-5'-phosphate decarboxylase [Arenicella xantha]|uniref:Orotidine 5'-phosphate decarboxylase n=1 Tax=Arenicella xantha TaxID=644221 RepID=A0A395JW76_9GAMM|nr:orotidine-5'-phosphate decarboxylase [Arenicella xantha]RBP53808.1 orotidine-5'-phosphate decarboxylase [Arenicella xantha]
MTFIEKLEARWEQTNSLLCVGLDPTLKRIPAHLQEHSEPIYQFCRAIVDATHDLVCAYKPQIAYFAGLTAEDQLQKTIDYIRYNYPHIPVILDSKRGDIGSTAEMYAAEAFDRYQAHAVTVNPYMGRDSAQPFLDRADKGTILLCRTSNPGAGDLQDLDVGGLPLYEKLAGMITNEWNTNNNCSLVVGATWPEQMARLREITGDMPFLVPGVGAQGGDVKALVEAGQRRDGKGLMINSSRGVIYAGNGYDFMDKAREVAIETRDLINQYRR